MCNCQTSMDIRGRCCPVEKSFKNCPARIDTMCWFFENDYECSKLFETLDGDKKSKDKIIFQFCSKNKMTSVRDKEHVCELYWNNQKKEQQMNSPEKELIEIINDCEIKSRDLRIYKPHLKWGFQGVDTTEIAEAYAKFVSLDNLYYLNTTHIQLSNLKELQEKTEAELYEYQQKEYHKNKKYFNTEILTPGTKITCFHHSLYDASSGTDYVITTATRTRLEGYFVCGNHASETRNIRTRPELIVRVYVGEKVFRSSFGF